MHASPRDSNSEAVSEVVGQILIFGILSTVLILSLLGFNVAREGATEQVVEVRGESVAQRIAGVVVDAALFAETNEAAALRLALPMDLPDDLEGQSYLIDLNGDDVTISVQGQSLQSALFSSGKPADVTVCDQDPRQGGPLQVVVTTDLASIPSECVPGGATRVIFLEDAA